MHRNMFLEFFARENDMMLNVEKKYSAFSFILCFCVSQTTLFTRNKLSNGNNGSFTSISIILKYIIKIIISKNYRHSILVFEIFSKIFLSPYIATLAASFDVIFKILKFLLIIIQNNISYKVQLRFCTNQNST